MLISDGTKPFNCPAEPNSNGTKLAAINTVASPKVVPSGRAGAAAVPFARFWPKNDTIDPGDSGAPGTKLAPFTAALRMGACDPLPSAPTTCSVPVRLRVESVAVTVTVTGPWPLPDCHVLCHVPPWIGTRLTAASPFEKEAVTSPLFSRFPQSSVTCASSSTGHAAGT